MTKNELTMTKNETYRQRVGAGILLVLVALGLKLPLILLTTIFPAGAGDVVPATSGTVLTGIGNTALLVTAGVFLALRRWVGLGVTALIVVLSTGGAVELMGADYAVWGVLQLATNALAVIGMIAAITTGALRGSRW